MGEPNVVTVAVAAAEKSCIPQTIYNALDRGDLNGTRVGNTRLVFRDETFEAWQPKLTGVRAAQKAKEE